MDVAKLNLATDWWGYSVSNSLVTGLVVALIAVFAIVYVGMRISGKAPQSLAWRYLAYFGVAVVVVVGIGFFIGLEDMMVRPQLLQTVG